MSATTAMAVMAVLAVLGVGAAAVSVASGPATGPMGFGGMGHGAMHGTMHGNATDDGPGPGDVDCHCCHGGYGWNESDT